ncbi:MAG: hypothetical protein KGZ63_14635 [Clostridiales bacterium]|jgi:hypothetical protein|nr:hypothetical protein [Clostridiales bacterium]
MFNSFSNYLTVEHIYNLTFSCIPNKNGLYIVKKPKGMKIVISPNTTAIAEYKGSSMLYNEDILLSKYQQSDREILYIGKAGGNRNKLKQRIRQFVKYGYCLVDNHRGGRAIWQIENNKTLLLGFVECDNPEKKENDLLTKYLLNYGVLPLANWKIG